MPAFNGATLVQLPMEFGNPGVEVWPPWSLLLLPGVGSAGVCVCVCVSAQSLSLNQQCLNQACLEPNMP